MSFLPLLVLGLCAGVISGLLGIGGGVLLVPALVMLAGVDIRHAIGISLAVIVPTAFVAACKHHLEGNVDFKVAALVAVGGIVGAYLGAALANSVPEASLKRIFGVLLIVLGLNMVFGWSSGLAKRAELAQRGEARVHRG